jgi:hypothetical protein
MEFQEDDLVRFEPGPKNIGGNKMHISDLKSYPTPLWDCEVCSGRGISHVMIMVERSHDKVELLNCFALLVSRNITAMDNIMVSLA